MYSMKYTLFISYLEKKSMKSDNWKFWSQFVMQDALAYIGLYLGIRSGNWDVRLASLKLMAPLFCAYDHINYKQLICHHTADVLALPNTILECFAKGGFVVSIGGNSWHSVAVDESHEMMISLVKLQ